VTPDVAHFEENGAESTVSALKCASFTSKVRDNSMPRHRPRVERLHGEVFGVERIAFGPHYLLTGANAVGRLT
jgi:hypothetical protein